MRRHRTAAVVAIAVALVTVAATACGGGTGEPSVTTLTVAGAWARATPAGAGNGAVYLTVTSPTEDAIVGVAVPRSVAADAQMHSAMAGDDSGSMANMPGMDHDEAGAMAEMVPLDHVDLPAGEAVAFEPGHRHIMLTDLVDGLEEGEVFDLTLRFRHGDTRSVPVEVATNAP